MVALFAAILVPFFLFGDYFEDLAALAAEHRLSVAMAVAVIDGLLALDVFLLVPSSVVSAAAGAPLGFFWGYGRGLGRYDGLVSGLSRRGALSIPDPATGGGG
ncbi:hypothetical protein [Streptomyces sp. NPDC001276]|uniref:hypothetical protein n=1 Tax=unclassified Streptomyces TaxID=2593676 RepID=UPI0036B44EF2